MKRTILGSIAKSGSALTRAQRMIYAVSRVGFQWPDLVGPMQKVEEELGELKKEIFQKRPSRDRLEAELGDFLFTICNLAYFLKIDPDRSLHKMLHRFQKRFDFVEKSVEKSGRPWRELSLAELDEFWNQAKRAEKLKTRRRRKGRHT